jgi:hypothetical protein
VLHLSQQDHGLAHEPTTAIDNKATVGIREESMVNMTIGWASYLPRKELFWLSKFIWGRPGSLVSAALYVVKTVKPIPSHPTSDLLFCKYLPAVNGA